MELLTLARRQVLVVALGTRQENGPSDDIFRVYWRSTDGKLNGQIGKSLKDGLATPETSFPLFRVSKKG